MERKGRADGVCATRVCNGARDCGTLRRNRRASVPIARIYSKFARGFLICAHYYFATVQLSTGVYHIFSHGDRTELRLGHAISRVNVDGSRCLECACHVADANAVALSTPRAQDCARPFTRWCAPRSRPCCDRARAAIAAGAAIRALHAVPLHAQHRAWRQSWGRGRGERTKCVGYFLFRRENFAWRNKTAVRAPQYRCAFCAIQCTPPARTQSAVSQCSARGHAAWALIEH
eukprot:IDg17479t1